MRSYGRDSKFRAVNAFQGGPPIATIEQVFEATTGAIFAEGVALIDKGLALLAENDLGPVPPEDLGLDIKAIRSRIDRLEAQCARRVEQFDRCRGFGPSGDTSTTNWLRNHCHMSGFSADKHLKFARQLPELEGTQKALESGAIGIEHALEIARATEDLGSGAERELLLAAKVQDPAELRQTAKQIRHREDPQGLAAQVLEQYRKRRLHLFQHQDGMLGLDGALPAEGGVALKRCLESLIGTPGKDDDRTQQQRQADALLEPAGASWTPAACPARTGASRT